MSRLAVAPVAVAACLALAAAPAAYAAPTERVSLGFAGSQGNGFSATAAMSADGRYVAFVSGTVRLG